MPHLKFLQLIKYITKKFYKLNLINLKLIFLIK